MTITLSPYYLITDNIVFSFRGISFAFRKKGLTLFALILADNGNSKCERYSKADIHGISHGQGEDRTAQIMAVCHRIDT